MLRGVVVEDSEPDEAQGAAAGACGAGHVSAGRFCPRPPPRRGCRAALEPAATLCPLRLPSVQRALGPPWPPLDHWASPAPHGVSTALPQAQHRQPHGASPSLGLGRTPDGQPRPRGRPSLQAFAELTAVSLRVSVLTAVWVPAGLPDAGSFICQMPIGCPPEPGAALGPEDTAAPPHPHRQPCLLRTHFPVDEKGRE